jgi:hypothetical protein
VFGGEVADALADQPGLHRRAARRVDDDRDGVAARAEGAVEQRRDGLDIEPARTRFRGDHAVKADDGNDRAALTERAGQPADEACRFAHISPQRAHM